jgi:hypothetical protein
MNDGRRRLTSKGTQMKTTRRGKFAVGSRRTAAAWIASFVLVAAACDVTAQEYVAPLHAEHAPVALELAEVERLFWSCDYVATTRGVDSAPVDVCSAATEALKNTKFGGDFMALLAWWRGNKPVEHARLSRLTGESAPSGQPDDGTTAQRTGL